MVTQDKLLDTFNQTTQMFFFVMIVLSMVGLMVGGIGVVAIMMISVTERTREIGVRKALGATRREILFQFLVEASTLTLIGCTVGIVLGALGAWAIRAVSPIEATIGSVPWSSPGASSTISSRPACRATPATITSSARPMPLRRHAGLTTTVVSPFGSRLAVATTAAAGRPAR